eukprot:COSAG01_NODE_3852_length_5629_cov_3.080108_6_plen_161_part_00
MIDVLGMSHIKDSKIGDAETRGISGGQRKRVNIAMELVAKPSILFLDEPTSVSECGGQRMACDVDRLLTTLAVLGWATVLLGAMGACASRRHTAVRGVQGEGQLTDRHPGVACVCGVYSIGAGRHLVAAADQGAAGDGQAGHHSSGGAAPAALRDVLSLP